MASRVEDTVEDTDDSWKALASSSHQRRREAREAEHEAEMQRLEILEAEEEKKALALREKAWERTNHVMDFTRRKLLNDIAAASDDDESTGEEVEVPRDRNGREMFLAQREEDSPAPQEEDPQINLERRGDGSFEDGDSEPDPEKSGLKEFYAKANNSQQLLIVMSYGLKTADGSRYLADFVDDPLYANMTNKSSFHPTVPILKAEMKRRARARGFTKFKKNSALKPECLEWLKANPVVNIDDIAFLRKEEGKTYEMLSDLQEEKQRDEQAKRDRSNWTTIQPWLRLYHCMVHDLAKIALASLGKVLNKNELQNRNDEERPHDYYEVVCELYNDESIIFVSNAMPSLHASFNDPLILRFFEMPGGKLSAEDVKRKVTESKARTLQVSFRLPLLPSFPVGSYDLSTSFPTVQRLLQNGKPAVMVLASDLTVTWHLGTGLPNT